MLLFFGQCRRTVFCTLTAPLEKQHKPALDNLLISKGEQPSRLAWLLQPSGKINGNNVLQHIDRLNSISALELPEGIAFSVHQTRAMAATLPPSSPAFRAI